MHTTDDPDALLSTMEVAARLQVHHKTVRKLVERGALTVIRYTEHGHLRFRQRDVEAFMAASVVTPKENHV
jgi:excisionase family DNA binding protein